LLEVDNTLIDKEIARVAATPQGENGDRPSTNEGIEFAQWALKAGKVGQDDIDRRASAMKFPTVRDRILWKTKEFQRYVEVHGAVTPVQMQPEPSTIPD
jgi:hypothetical protein